MRIVEGRVRVAASDVANFLACQERTAAAPGCYGGAGRAPEDPEVSRIRSALLADVSAETSTRPARWLGWRSSSRVAHGGRGKNTDNSSHRAVLAPAECACVLGEPLGLGHLAVISGGRA